MVECGGEEMNALEVGNLHLNTNNPNKVSSKRSIGDYGGKSSKREGKWKHRKMEKEHYRISCSKL